MPVGRRKNPEVPSELVSNIVSKVTLEMGLTQLARSVIIYLIGVSLNYGNQATSRALKIPHPNVSHHCILVEDKRDDPAFDAQLTKFEEAFSDSN